MSLLTGAAAAVTDRPVAVAEAGDRGASLLAGPATAEGAESLFSHHARLGPLRPRAMSPDFILQAVAESGLQGRGGAGFPVARKMAATAAALSPVVVVNGSESEPASRKDRELLRLRPHLVLDGAALAAAAVGAGAVVIQLHRGADAPLRALEVALAERRVADIADPRVRLALGPPRYVAGESTAVRSFISGGPAMPGVAGRRGGSAGPTMMVQNVETIALIALIARHGPEWLRSLGTPASPGPGLVTLAGAVREPGLVLEVSAPERVGRVLADWGGVDRPPQAVLFGGYAGSWVDGPSAWQLELTRDGLAGVDVPFGCGLVGVLPWDGCGLRETARLLGYLAAEGSGQCGPCAFGLPRLARLAAALADGVAGRREVRAMARTAADVAGRGACHHPDGAVGLLDRALTVFADDVSWHLRRGPCSGAERGPVFPVPEARLDEWR